jgi:phosphoglycerate dehydrogenase-like enzyme
MNVFLVGEAANHRGLLQAALGADHEVIGLPREAASSSQHDVAIAPDDVVVALRFSRRGTAVPDFRMLHVPGAGLDGIDFGSLPARCTVCNVFEHEIPIAEYVCCAMLEWEIRLSAMRRAFNAGSWSDLYRHRVPHGELCGKTLLLVGYGRIGQAIARRARAFDMHVIVVARSAATLDAAAGGFVGPEALHEVLPHADYVAIACPLNETTRGMFDAAALSRMKPTGVLINVSRAEIADEKVLYDALAQGRIGGAVLDVWYQYPKGADDRVPPASHPFDTLPNVVCTAHSAAWTDKLPQRRFAFIADNILRLARGEPLRNVVRAPLA